jgi:hypothetical protein
MNKVQAYKSLIGPLMAEVTRICESHGIAMIAGFDIEHDEDEDDSCLVSIYTFLLPDEDGENNPQFEAALDIIKKAS